MKRRAFANLDSETKKLILLILSTVFNVGVMLMAGYLRFTFFWFYTSWAFSVFITTFFVLYRFENLSTHDFSDHTNDDSQHHEIYGCSDQEHHDGYR